jgi:hypothetical protein
MEMWKFHVTLSSPFRICSRREFMVGFGVGLAGIGDSGSQEAEKVKGKNFFISKALGGFAK